MNRAEAFAELASITPEIETVSKHLAELMERERELYGFLKMPYRDDRPRRKRSVVPEETKQRIRQVLTSISKEFVTKWKMHWVSSTLILNKAEQELPSCERDIIGRELRWLASKATNPITHNGIKGQGSSYTYVVEMEQPTQ